MTTKDKVIPFIASKENDEYINKSIYRSGYYCAFICGERLRHYFNIPPNKEKIYVRLSKTPSKESYKLIKDGLSIMYIILSSGEEAYETISVSAEHELAKFGYPLYVSIEHNI